MTLQKLKLGILLDSHELAAWEYYVLERVTSRNVAEITLLILNGCKGEKGSADDSFLYSLFNRIDVKLFGKEPNPFTPKNIRELLPTVPEISVYPAEVNGSYTLNHMDLVSIREYHLDILIRFGFKPLQCQTLNASKYGTWFYIHSDDQKMEGTPPGFWEVVDNCPETGSALLSMGGEIALNRTLYRSYFFTYPLSPARHRSYYFWAAASFLPRQIEFLHRYGEKNFRRQLERFNVTSHTEIKKYNTPSNLQTVKAIVMIGSRLMTELFKRIFYFDQWFLLFSFEKEIPQGLGEFNVLVPPKDKFWADPHVIQANDKYYIFFEEFCHTKNKGHISVIELDQFGHWKPPVTVMEKEYHLSYPFVFKWHDKFYMIPESGENKTIDIYECVEFPNKWEFRQNLMENVMAVDSNLVRYAGKWWLFTAIAEHEAAAPNYELFLFYADDLFSKEWKAHTQNPIISDVKSARPAGGLFVKDGKLFRPSQDCSKMYGYGFDLNEIEVLSETQYCERKVLSVRPVWDKRILATHTFSNKGNLTVIDAFRRKRKL